MEEHSWQTEEETQLGFEPDNDGGSEWEVSDELPLDFEPQPTLSVVWGSSEYIRVRSVPVVDYDGAYEVTPTDRRQVLNTANRYLAENVTVNEIPYYETSNESGGLTVSILS